MPVIYSYRKVTDTHTTYDLLLPEIADDAPGCIDLGEISGVSYVLLPAGVSLPPQPQQVMATLQEITSPSQGLITSLLATSALLTLMKDRIQGKKITPRYSLSDELTLAQVYDWLPPGLLKNVEEGRAWAK